MFSLPILTGLIAASTVFLSSLNAGSVASPEVRVATTSGSPTPFFSTFRTASSTLLSARGQHMTVVVGSYIYVFGGRGLKPSSTVERAPITKDGIIGSFEVVPELTLSCVGGACINTGAFVYVFGASGDIWQSSIRGDSSLGKFKAIRNIHLIEPRFSPVITRIGNFVYVLGGTDGDEPAQIVERATLNSKGEIGPFSEVRGVTLATSSSSPALISTGKYLYFFSGNPDVPVEVATISRDGNLSSFTSDLSVKPVINRGATSVVKIDSVVYLIGGSNTTGTLASIERSIVNAEGRLGSFSVVPRLTLQTARHSNTCLVIKDQVVILGGITYDPKSKKNFFLNTVETADFGQK